MVHYNKDWVLEDLSSASSDSDEAPEVEKTKETSDELMKKMSARISKSLRTKRKALDAEVAEDKATPDHKFDLMTS